MSDYAKQWFGLLGSAIAWFLHLLVASAIGEGACVLKGALFRFLGLTAAGWALIVASLLGLGLCFASLRAAWSFRNAQQPSIQFMGNAGVISGLLFFVILLAQSMPIVILLNGC